MSGCMSELIGPRYIPAGINIFMCRGPEILIHFNRSLLGELDAYFFQTKSFGIGRSPGGDQNLVEFNPLGIAVFSQ